MKHKKLFVAAVVTAASLGMGLWGTGVVSAHGFFGAKDATPEEIAKHHQQMFAKQAELLGINADAVKAGWAEGKSFKEMAETNGISKEQLAAKMKTLKLSEMKSHLNTLVSKGVITQAQADSRYTAMQTHMDNAKGKMKGMRHNL